MNEAAAGLIGTVGSVLRGSIGGHPACGSCTHIHRVTDHGTSGGGAAIDITYDIACPEPDCYCTASAESYDRGIVDVPVPSAWATDERWCADNGVRPADRSGHECDPIVVPPGVIFNECELDRSSDTSATLGVVEGQRVRRGRELARPGLGLLGWLGYLRTQLGRLWWPAGLWTGVVGDAGRTDHGGDADPVEPTGSERLLRELVDARPEPPPFRPNLDLIGYMEAGQHGHRERETE